MPARLIKFNVDAVFVNELNFCLYILKAYNNSYRTHITMFFKTAFISEKLNLK